MHSIGVNWGESESYELEPYFHFTVSSAAALTKALRTLGVGDYCDELTPARRRQLDETGAEPGAEGCTIESDMFLGDGAASPADAPPLCDAKSRAEAEAILPETERAWLKLWKDRVECWYMALPKPTQIRLSLGSCVSALGLHLGSRLEGAWRAAQAAIGQTPTSAAADTSLPSGCTWVGDHDVLELPEFPQFPEHFEVPPVPRWLPSTDRLEALSEMDQQNAAGHQPQAAAPTSFEAGILGAGSGAIGALAVFVGLRLWGKRKAPHLGATTIGAPRLSN